MTSDYSQFITMQLRDRRKSLNYSQEYMAAKMQCSQKGYSKLELGIVKLTMDRFLIICDLLDLNPELLLRSPQNQQLNDLSQKDTIKL